MDRAERIRAFVALELPEPTRAAIGQVLSDLRGSIAGVRWVHAEGVHLTLRFLGWSDPEALRRLEPALGRAATACPPVEAHLRGAGLFPERGAPRVLWIGVDLPDAVGTLQRACEEAAAAAGFPAEERPFRPHLTLGRFRDRVPRPRLPPLDLGPARLDRLVLFRSDLKPSGAVYTPLAVLPLGGG
jgi:RNA 2',3'-cyclic 3'-phosphodiesterase